MPFDKSGKHHLNTQKAMASDKAPAKAPAPPVETAPAAPMTGTQTIIDHNDDGTFSVTHADGEQSGPFMDMAEALDTVMAKDGGMEQTGEAMPQEQTAEQPAMMGM